MTLPADAMPPFERLGCSVCMEGAGLAFDFSMAFQPIVDAVRDEIFAYEALVRGPEGEGADRVLENVTPRNRYRFDQCCRVRAIEFAARAGLDRQLNINFLPNAVYQAESCIQVTLEAARAYGFPHEHLCFEVVESEKVEDHDHLASIIREYRRQGLVTAIDDFGAGYAGLNLLAAFQPDLLKLDMALTRTVDADRPRQIIVDSVLTAARELGIRVIAEGIETEAEFHCLRELGVELFQGYLLAKPAFERFETAYHLPT